MITKNEYYSKINETIQFPERPTARRSLPPLACSGLFVDDGNLLFPWIFCFSSFFGFSLVVVFFGFGFGFFFGFVQLVIHFRKLN
jgi:hypothetical protein